MPSAMKKLDIVIVGAGFASVFMLHAERKLGLDARVIEAASGPGGTWFWNRYPGARYDIESMQYSYQFDNDLQQEWEWSEKYAAQPELWRYIAHVIRRFYRASGIQYSTRVQSAAFAEIGGRWVIETASGEQLSRRFCVMTTGCLAVANKPTFKGQESFHGALYHTGEWPHAGVDFTRLRVAVIGTGSSAIRAIPLIAEQAAHLTVFQRTPASTMPAQNRPLTRAEQEAAKARYGELRSLAKAQTLAFDIRQK